MMQLLTNFAVACSGGTTNFLGFPTWYKYLNGKNITEVVDGKEVVFCNPAVSGINDIWLILAAVIEILLRVGALLAIGYIIYGGIKYIMSQAEPDRTAQAKSTIVNALIGLIIAIGATGFITFIAGRFN